MLAMSKERGAETSKENTREIRQSTTDNTHTHIYIHRRRNYHQWPFDRENKWYHHLKHEPCIKSMIEIPKQKIQFYWQLYRQHTLTSHNRHNRDFNRWCQMYDHLLIWCCKKNYVFFKIFYGGSCFLQLCIYNPYISNMPSLSPNYWNNRKISPCTILTKAPFQTALVEIASNFHKSKLWWNILQQRNFFVVYKVFNYQIIVQLTWSIKISCVNCNIKLLFFIFF